MAMVSFAEQSSQHIFLQVHKLFMPKRRFCGIIKRETKMNGKKWFYDGNKVRKASA